MLEFLASSQGTILLFIALAVQFQLVKYRVKWFSFIIPGIYFVLSLATVVKVVQTGDVLAGGIAGTVLLAFLVNNITTLTLLAMYWKRNAGNNAILLAAFLTYMLANAVFMILMMAVTALSV